MKQLLNILSVYQQKKNIVMSMLSFFIICPFLGFGQDNDRNWVEQIVYKTPVSSTISNPDANQAEVKLVYKDGLGRPVQTIANQMSGIGDKDIVTYIEYDAFGRQSRSFLPYRSDSNTMAYDGDVHNTIASYPGQMPFSETEFEASPLSRPIKQSAPGTASNWAMGSGHETHYGYSIENGLFKTLITDPNNKVNETYKNARGQLVMKRDDANGERLETYYEYDLSGNLVKVYPPIAGNPQSGGNLDNLGYQYNYDDKNRLVSKKLPGKEREYIIYDALDRIVAKGPAYSPTNPLDTAWLINFYDDKGRVALTGWYSSPIDATRAQNLQASMGAVNNVERLGPGNQTTIDHISTNYSIPVDFPGFTLLTVNYYDNYDFPDAPSSFSNPSTIYYNDVIKPQGLPTGSWVRVFANTGNDVGESSYILYDYRARPIMTHKNNYLRGYTTKIITLNGAGQLEAAQTLHKRLNADDELVINETLEYSSQGRLYRHFHQIGNQPVEFLSANTYDGLGRLVLKKVGRTEGSPLQNVNYNYNIRGWLTDINDVSAQPGEDLFSFKINYDQVLVGENAYPSKATYNGNISETYWRTSSDNILRKYSYEYDGVNRMTNAIYQKPEIDNPLTESYNESVSYDVNGNLQTMQRNGNSDSDFITLQTEIDDLTYHYDADVKDRLLSIDDASNNPNGFNDNSGGAAEFGYDTFGNLTSDYNKFITKISYNHLNLPTEIIFNNNPNKKIIYIYNALGEKVQKVVHFNATAVRTIDYLDGFQYSGGKLLFFPTSEGYVKCTEINQENHYNYAFNYLDHLGNVRLTYGLDPENAEITKVLEENQYYPYGLKHTNYNMDVQGYGKNANVEQVMLKEPPGEPENNESAMFNKYKFNGMEYQDELGLNLYDMDMRDYDPAISRWLGIDPVVHHGQSPYMAMNGNPVTYADPSGADGITITIDWNQLSNNAATVIQHADSNTSALEAFHMAILSADVYDGSLNVGAIGYTRDTSRNIQYTNDRIGFKSMLYNQTSTNRYVYATAGSDDGADWWNNATQLAGLSKQYDLSVKNAIRLKEELGNNLSFTGHSLGGGLAEANAIATGLHATTFNAAALSWFTKRKLGNNTSNTDAHILLTDPLNLFQRAVLDNRAGGRIIEEVPTDLNALINGHSIYSMIRSLAYYLQF